jgi:hypothetical protein
MKKNLILAALLLLGSGCASLKKTSTFTSDDLSSDELANLDNLEPPMEMIMVEELPPPPSADQYSSPEKQKANALADTTVYLSSQLEAGPQLYYKGQNLAFYLEEQVNKAKAEIKETGAVTIRAIVERDGSLTNPILVNSASEALTKHSLAIVNQMPKFGPGSLNGYPRRAYVTMYFTW